MPSSFAGRATVPEKMIGCWETLSIRFSDGTEDKTTRAIWLQTLSGVGDIRIPARPNLRDCEFSYARRAQTGDDYNIVVSILPWREGKSLGYPWIQDLASKVKNSEGLVMGDNWMLERLWCP